MSPEILQIVQIAQYMLVGVSIGMLIGFGIALFLIDRTNSEKLN